MKSHAALPADLLLLPGLMCDDAFWEPLLPELPSSMSARVVDYGQADTLEAMAGVALAQATERFALAGHSMGGRVALELLRLAPTRVQRLVLMDTGCLPLAAGIAGERERAGRLALVDLARRDGVAAMALKWLQGMLHPAKLHDPLLVSEVIQMFCKKSVTHLAGQQNALLTRADASAVLQGLRMPVLLLCGRQDAWANVAQHEAMRALTPHAELVVIEDAGHMTLMEQAMPTARAITDFLSKN